MSNSYSPSLSVSIEHAALLLCNGNSQDFEFVFSLPQFQLVKFRIRLAVPDRSQFYVDCLYYSTSSDESEMCLFFLLFSYSFLSSQRAMCKLSTNHIIELYTPHITFVFHYFYYSYYVSARCFIIVVNNVRI